MKPKLAIVQLIASVIALLIASWFVHAYSQYAELRIRYDANEPELTNATLLLWNYSLFALVLPLLVAVAGVVTIAKNMELGTSIVCHSGWLLAMALICFTIVAWNVNFIPQFGPLK